MWFDHDYASINTEISLNLFDIFYPCSRQNLWSSCNAVTTFFQDYLNYNDVINSVVQIVPPNLLAKFAFPFWKNVQGFSQTDDVIIILQISLKLICVSYQSCCPNFVCNPCCTGVIVSYHWFSLTANKKVIKSLGD